MWLVLKLMHSGMIETNSVLEGALKLVLKVRLSVHVAITVA